MGVRSTSLLGGLGAYPPPPPRKILEMKHPEIESQTIFRYFDAYIFIYLFSVLQVWSLCLCDIL